MSNSIFKRVGLIAVLVGTFGLQAQAETKAVDTAKSEVRWTGKKVTGSHDGTVKIKDGSLELTKGEIQSGQVTIDMASITVLDIKDAGTNGKLTGHLKSDDFFSVDKHPTAVFKLTKIEKAAGKDGTNSNVTGDLTIKGITKPLSFPATITSSKAGVKVSAKGIKVDRTLYDIRYGSGKFFEGLGDKVIYDDFLIDLDLVTK